MTRWKYDYTKKRVLGKTLVDAVETLWNFWIKKRCIVCDMIGDYDVLHHKESYIREDYWTDESLELLHEIGYRKCEDLPDHDNIAWWGVPVLIKFHNFKMIEITDPAASQDDPMFLNDRMESNLLNKFARSLARAAALAGMDLQKIILMTGIGIAAVVGMKVMGVF